MPGIIATFGNVSLAAPESCVPAARNRSDTTMQRQHRLRAGSVRQLFHPMVCLAIVAGGAGCWFMPSAHAVPLADITWGAATNISGDSDVDTTGTLVYAYNFGSSSSATAQTVNGVTFQPFVILNNLSTSFTTGQVTISESPGYLASDLNVGSGTAPFSNLSTSYRGLLASEVYASQFANIRVDLGGLTPGNEYRLQWWTNDSAMTPYFPGSQRYLFENTFSSGSVNSVTLDSNTANVVGGLGQYVIGTFTAGGATASFTLTGSGTGLDQLPLLNALQVRAVPEPSTYAMGLAGLACGGYSVWRRRRRA